MKTLAERIKEAQDALVTKKDELVIATKSLEANPDDESLLHQVEELTSQVEKSTASINALTKAEAALADRARTQAANGEVNAPAVISARQKSADEEGMIWKMGAVNLIAYAQKKTVEQVMAERYKGNTALAAAIDYVHKTAVNPAMTTVAGWAQELVQNDVRGFLDTLKTISVAAALASRSQSVSFDGFNSITMPRRNPRAANQRHEPAWVGEAGYIPLTQFSFGSTVMSRFKLAAITTFSREIAERSTPQIEGLLRAALSEAYAEVLDDALLSAGAAVANVRPAGLLAGVTVAAGTAGGGDDAVRADVKAMITSLMATRGGVRPVLMVNDLDRLSLAMMTSPMSDPIFAGELASGRLLGIDIISSANVPQGTAIAVDAAAFASAFDAPQFDVSDVATVVEANADGAAPTHAGTAGAHAGAIGTAGQVPLDGGIPVNGGVGAANAGFTARSLWQTYSLGIRMVAPTSWALLRPGSVAAVNTLTW
jgi:HK97 family phage major capsid protein